MPTKKRPSRKSLVKKLDELTSLIIRARDKRCVQCGSKENLTNGHVLPGRYHALRWDIRPDGNCHTQCWPCNYKHGQHQSFYYDWYIQKFGYERFQALRREYYGSPVKYSDKELSARIEQYKRIYEGLS